MIKRSYRLTSWIGIGLALATLSACSSTPELESSLEEASVTGTVKVHGKLLEGGELHFSAVNPNRKVEVRNTPIAKDGTFTTKALIGLNTVTVTPPKPRNKKQDKEFFGVNSDERTVVVKSGEENTAELDFLP